VRQKVRSLVALHVLKLLPAKVADTAVAQVTTNVTASSGVREAASVGGKIAVTDAADTPASPVLAASCSNTGSGDVLASGDGVGGVIVAGGSSAGAAAGAGFSRTRSTSTSTSTSDVSEGGGGHADAYMSPSSPSKRRSHLAHVGTLEDQMALSLNLSHVKLYFRVPPPPRIAQMLWHWCAD
jgi:hypothetical protein